MTTPTYYPSGPVALEFLKSDAFVAGIMGPIGSGKSTACIVKLIQNFNGQAPGADGWKRRRTAIIRNTYSELRTTTIKSFHQWIPPYVGNYRDSAPPTQTIEDSANRTHWEVLFVALDRPDDVRKLLSMELSDAFINEAREVPKAILDGLSGRVGRFPPTVRDGNGDVLFGCTDPQIILDTNPPDSDHWWYRLAEDPSPEERAEMEELEAQLREMCALRADQPLYRWFRQPGGESPAAENLQNLPLGYYLKAKANKGAEWVKVYVNAEYGYVMDGRPVYPDFRDAAHVRDFKLNPSLPLHIGMDFGLTPAAVFGQRLSNGQWRKHSELVSENMGIVRFAEEVKRHLTTHYPRFEIGNITGDPAGDARNDDERTTYDILKAGGIAATPARTNDPIVRIESVTAAMRRMLDGEPGMLIHPQCRVLRKAYAGGYHFKRIQISGSERYRDTPDKDMFSHVADADQYLMLGAGEGRSLLLQAQRALTPRPERAISDYD